MHARFLRLGKGKFALSAAIVIVGVLVVILVLNLLFAIPVAQALAGVGLTATAVGVFLALLTLRDTHEWNRRHYTVEFLHHWNESARKHLVVLEKEFPEFFAVPDFIAYPNVMEEWCLDKGRAGRIVKGEPELAGTGLTNLDIRGHLIELLNYFEGIATAYEEYVVDRAAVEDVIRTVILDVCVYFQPFIEEMRKNNRRDPWPPLSRVVAIWLTGDTRRSAQAQAKEATRRHQEALEKAQQNLRKQTGI